MKKILFFIIVPCCLWIYSSNAEMYKHVDEDGRVSFSDRPPMTKTATNIVKEAPTARLHSISGSRSKAPQSTDTNNHLGAGHSISPKLEVRRLLEGNEFSSLTLVLKSYEADVQKTITAEDSLYDAYSAFEIIDSHYEPLFDSWLRASNNGYEAYLGRAYYYHGKGWASRGYNWSSEIEKEKLNDMNFYFEKASKDLNSAIKKNSRSQVAYSLLSRIANSSGNHAEAKEIYNTAIVLNPASYQVRASYLNALTPRWHGSYEEMENFVRESLEYVEENPKLRLLQGDQYFDMADLNGRLKMYTKADELYNKALSYGDNHKILKSRGVNHYKMEHYKLALADLNQAIGLYPEDGNYYYWRSKVYWKLERWKEAAADIQRADVFAPHSKKIENQKKELVKKLVHLGYEYKQKLKNIEALNKFNEALELDSLNSYIYFRRARVYMNLFKYDEAINDLKTAIGLDSSNYSYFTNLDFLLFQRKDYDQIIRYWGQYIELYPTDHRAYLERAGTNFHKKDFAAAKRDAKKSADLGNPEAKSFYQRLENMGR